MHNMYVDDCLPGGPSWDETLKIVDELKLALEGSFSGHDPPENLSSDQESILMGGGGG